MSETTAEENGTINLETEETSENESQETLESSDSDNSDEGLSDKAREFKEKRREENRLAREALKELPGIKAELEKQKYFKGQPEAEQYEKEIDAFRAENPTVPLDKAFRYVLADLNPAKLAEITDPALSAQRSQSRTAPTNGEKSFSEHIGDQPALTKDDMRKQAEKEWKKTYG